jgi:hypothetical protein
MSRNSHVRGRTERIKSDIHDWAHGLWWTAARDSFWLSASFADSPHWDIERAPYEAMALHVPSRPREIVVERIEQFGPAARL